MITRDEFQKEVTAILKGALEGLPEAAQIAKVSEVLQTAEATVSELLQTVSAKEEELSNLGEEKATLLDQVQELATEAKEAKEQLAALEADLKEKLAAAEERASAAEAVLKEAADAKALEARVAELAAAKVLRTGEKLEAQKEKVKAMNDEEFASYRDELVDLRSDLEAALKETATDEDAEETEEVVDVAPPAINKEEAAAAGALDVEIVKPQTLKDKYAKLGPAIAKRMGRE